MKRFRYFLFFGFYSALCISGLRAQDTLSVDTTRMYHIDEVSVSAKYHQTASIGSAQTLSGEALQQLNSHSVADALRYFSGVQIKDFGGIGGLKTVNIRSMGTNHVGVFYDGIELGNAQNGTIDLGKFSLDNMEAITVYNGEKSAVFQPAKDFGSSGSVYLQSKAPRFDDGKPYHVTATVKGGSFGTINPSLLWEQQLSSKMALSTSAEYLYTTGKYKFRYQTLGGYDTTAIRQNGDVNAVRAEVGLYGRVSEGSWRAKAYAYHSERGYPGAVVRGRFTHEDRQWDTNVFVQGSFQKSFGNVYSLMLKGKYAYDYLRYLADPNKDAGVMYVDNTYKQHEIYVSNANRWQIFPFWDMGLSVDFQWNKLDADLYDFVYPQRYALLGALATAFNFSHVKLHASVLGTFVQDHTLKSSANTQTLKFTPSVFASYQPSHEVDLTLRAFFKQSMRLPTFNDLYYTFIGNASLKPENTTQYDIGITYNQPITHWFPMLSLQIDGYFNQVTDKIVATPTSNFFRWTMINLGYVEIWGSDIALQTTFAPIEPLTLNLRLAYTYQRARDLSDPTSDYYGGQIPYIPRHSGSVTFSGHYKTWDLNYSFIYTGERYDSSANIAANYIQPWYTHDLSLSKAFQWSKAGLKLTAEVNNLFNQQYEVVRCYPMPGINFRAIAQVTF